MANRSSKKLYLFVIISMLVISIVAYLGSQTIAYQVLLQRYSIERQGKSELANLEYELNTLIRSKERTLLALADQPIEEINSMEIQQVFVMENKALTYPNTSESLTLKAQNFVNKIAPLIDEPTILYQSYLVEGAPVPDYGWYILYDHEVPLWVFWVKQGQKTIGFSLSYPYLMSQFLNQLADQDYSQNVLTIEENGQLLFQNHNGENATELYSEASLAFPFNHWQMKYYAEAYNGWRIYALGFVVIVMLCGILGWLFWRIYFEYQQTKRIAEQQVSFVSQVSHELKTPLTNISLFAELLQENPVEKETAQYSEIIVSESQRLTRLIQNILSFTKKRETNIVAFDLVELIQQVVRIFTPSLQSKQLTLNLTVPEKCPMTSDQDAITQIINNLLSNVEKYGASGKLIDLTLTEDEQNIVIEVRDYGDGIPSKYLSQIFKPFYRVHSKITEGVAGTGIGLTIVQQLAHSINGEITVHPQSKGVAFRLTLPKVNM